MSKMIEYNDENENDDYIEVSKNCKVTKSWLFKQKQVSLFCLIYLV